MNRAEPGAPDPAYPAPGYPPPGYPAYPPPGHGTPGYPPPGHGTPGYPPMAYPAVPQPRPRPNSNAFAVAAAVGGIVWFAGFAVTDIWAVRSTAYVAGASCATALMAAVPVAIIAWSSRSPWPVWRYAAIIVAVAVGLTAVNWVTVDRADPTGVAFGESPSGPTPQRRTAEVPAAVGTWTRDDSPAVAARREQALAQVQRGMGAGDDADMALYRSGREEAALLVVTTHPGSRLDAEAAESPAQAVVDALAGAGVLQRSMVDPGPLGGALGCGPSTKNTKMYLCTWVDRGTLGTLSFVDAQLAGDTAAEITREFRSATEH